MPQASAQEQTRIVSLVPAVTEMLFAIGAGARVVGVSSYDSFPREVDALPRVGGLLDPDYERVLRLRPTLVVTYGSQAEFERRLRQAGIPTYSYRHAGLGDTTRIMRELGAATGLRARADAAASTLESQFDAVRARVRGRGRPATLLVFGREPGSLRRLYAAGGVGFMHDLVEVAGGTNVFADVQRESVQPSIEQIMTRAPAVVVELHARPQPAPGALERERLAWQTLATVPAVRNGRISLLYGEPLTIPGPRIGQTAEALARAIHPGAF